MPEKVSREQLTKNYRRGAINYLFMYLYVLRFGRAPEGWEIGLARTLLTSDVVLLNEPENEDIRRIYNLVLDVDQSMNRAEEKKADLRAEATNVWLPCSE